jgi:hypothetical protein
MGGPVIRELARRLDRAWAVDYAAMERELAALRQEFGSDVTFAAMDYWNVNRCRFFGAWLEAERTEVALEPEPGLPPWRR